VPRRASRPGPNLRRRATAAPPTIPPRAISARAGSPSSRRVRPAGPLVGVDDERPRWSTPCSSTQCDRRTPFQPDGDVGVDSHPATTHRHGPLRRMGDRATAAVATPAATSVGAASVPAASVPCRIGGRCIGGRCVGGGDTGRPAAKPVGPGIRADWSVRATGSPARRAAVTARGRGRRPDTRPVLTHPRDAAEPFVGTFRGRSIQGGASSASWTVSDLLLLSTSGVRCSAAP